MARRRSSKPGKTASLKDVAFAAGVDASTVSRVLRGDDRKPAKAATREELEAELASLRAELKQIRKENQKLATERDILRKATKFFASEMTW